MLRGFSKHLYRVLFVLLFSLTACSQESPQRFIEAPEFSSQRINLIQDVVISEMDVHSGKLPTYDRLAHFGGWLNDSADDTCFNTRALVLLRDSEVEVETDEYNKCRIVAGYWKGIYIDGEFVNAGHVDIDHVVPLYNAYYSGAWKWSKAKRCHYSNYMKNDYHLITVSRSENRAKGSNGPETYMPPNQNFQCRYLGYWMKIKKVWELTMTSLEHSFISQSLKTLGCSTETYMMSSEELSQERAQVKQVHPDCLDD